MSIPLEIKNVYYGGNINIDKNIKIDDETKMGNIFKLYDKFKIDVSMNNDYTKIIQESESLIGKFFSKSVSYQNFSKNEANTKHMPPLGPIHEHCQCIICGNVGPQYHKEDCIGPYDFEKVVGYGMNFYSKKIAVTLSQEFIDEKYGEIFYKDIYPNRGIQKIESEIIKSSNFNNVFQVKYCMKNSEGEGIVIPVKVTPTYGMTIRNVPYVKDCDFKKLSHMLYSEIIKSYDSSIEYDNKNSWITNMNASFNLVDETKQIDLDKLFISIKEKYQPNDLVNSSLKGFISFKYNSDDGILKKQVIIRRGGSVTVFISYRKTKIEDKTHITYNSIKEECGTVYNIIKDIIGDKIVEKQQKKGILQDQKVMNMSIPYDSLGGNEIKYKTNIKTAKFPPQPSGCQNKGLSDHTSTTKANIRRPHPFSFSQGRPPCGGMVIRGEGVKSTGVKLLGGRLNLVEPCSEQISGKESGKNIIKNVKYSNDTDIITESQFDSMIEYKPCNNMEVLLQNIDDYITNTTSTKSKIFRRTMLGFPNNIYPEDSALFNNIEQGVEIVPDLPPGGKITDSKVVNTKSVVQDDINSAVYIPGTQLANYGGNNTFIRDSRCHRGLIHLFDEKYREALLRCIFNRLDNSYIESEFTIDNNTSSDIIYRNAIVYFHVIKDKDCPKNTVILKDFNNSSIKLIDIKLDGVPKKCLFVPAKSYSKINDNGIYMFRLNYYVDFDGIYRLIPNQPFILVDSFYSKNKKEYYKQVNDETLLQDTDRILGLI